MQQATQQASEAVLQVKVAVTAANAAATTSASISSGTGGAQAAAGSTPVAADESEPLSFFLALPLELEPFISRVHLALGSNLGDRVENIERALALLEVGLEAEEAAAKAAGEAAAAAEAEDGFELPAAAPCARPLALPAGAYLRVSDTSFLYETPPAYVLDQPAFVNAAAAVETNLSPLALLAHIKANIEAALGRPLLGAGAGAAPRFGPRVIDVDIVLWGARVLRLANGALQVPHQRLAERDFVLGPLADVAPEATHPTLHASVAALLHACTRNSSGGGGPSLRRVLPMPFRAWSGGAARATALVPLGARTLVMGVLNVTPDSFSDGGALEAGGVSAALEAAQRLVAAGADIVDIGGQSTRPGAAPVSAAAEAARVLPVIAALRSWLDATPAAAHVAISVDTFSARVAAAALRAGATMLNDVAAGGLDARMLRTAARARVPYVAMHMRGTPATMRGLAVYAGARGAAARAAGEVAQRAFAAGSGGGGSGGGEPAPAPGPAATEAAADAAAEATAAVVEVRTVLAARAAAAIAAGVRRWHFCVDPGLGFAKTTAHNLALLRAPGLAAALPFPSVYGPSRKAFIGELTGRARPADRVAGTCAAVSAAVAVGADIVRVHDVAEAADAAKVADAVWRAQA